MKLLLDEIEFADRVGLDVFGVGEHHRAEFLDSAPETILAAAAVRTERIRLTSAVTVLSANDSVRVHLRPRLLSSIHTFFALRDYFPVLSFVVLPRTLAGFRLFR